MDYDILIIGAGPAGYVAAIRAGQLGMKTALLEKNEIGGMCLNWGCIPTKALIESAKLYQRIKTSKKMGIDGVDPKAISFNWKEAKKRANQVKQKLTGGINILLEKNGVDIIQGEAKIISDNSVSINNRTLVCGNILIATGSYPAPIDLPIPPKKILQVNQLLNLESLPERLLLFGHGSVTLELAQFFSMIDRKVTILSPSEDILPGVDSYLSDFLLDKVKSQGIDILSTSNLSLSSDKKLVLNKKVLDFDMAINCSWRNGVIPENNINLALTDNKYIKVDENLQCSTPGIYAAGDVNGMSYLAHVASAQGLFIVNHIKGIKSSMEIKNFPINMYTVPEISQIGLTETEIMEQGLELRIRQFPMTANGKALAEDAAEGFIRILSEKKFGEVLGVQIAAANATDMITEAAAMMSVEANVYDIAKTIHTHPTISEVFLEYGMEANK